MKLPLSTLPASVLLFGVAHDALADNNAAAWSDFDTNFDHYSTSEHYRRNTTKLTYQHSSRNAGQLTQYGINGAVHTIGSKHGSYRVNEVDGKIRAQVSQPIMLEGHLGNVAVKKPQGSTQNITTHKERVEWQANSKVLLAAEHNQDALFREEIALDNQQNVIRTQATAVEAFAYPTPNTAVSTRLQRKRYSDGNRSHDEYVSAFYGIAPAKQTPHLWVGMEGVQMDHDRHETRYWSPQHYRYVGAKVYGDTQLSPNLTLNSSLSSGRSRDKNSNGSVNSWYATVGAKFKVSPASELSLDARRGNSRRDNERWKGNGVTLNYNYHF